MLSICKAHNYDEMVQRRCGARETLHDPFVRTSMHRVFCFALALAAATEFLGPPDAPAQWDWVPLIFQEQAEQVGLKRAWYSQIPLYQARSKVTHLTFQSGLLLAVTDQNMLHVVDA